MDSPALVVILLNTDLSTLLACTLSVAVSRHDKVVLIPSEISGQIVYTLEVYTLIYSYISVKYVSLLIIARASSCDVGCLSVLGWK